MIWRSTTIRFAALVFLFQLAAAAALFVAVGAILRNQITADVQQTAEVLRADLLATYAQGGAPAVAREIEVRSTRLVSHGAVMLLVRRDGMPLAGNVVAWPAGMRTVTRYVELEVRRVGRDRSEPVRARATLLPGGERLLTGATIERERRLLRLFEEAALLALALALAFAALAAWLAARLIVHRLDGTIATLRAVREGDLARRVPGDPSGDAFATLASEVNGALDRVDALVGELTIATDGLAHDLKSPLTRLRSALERATAAVTEPAAQDALDRAQAEGDRLLAMVETALGISRAEAGIGKGSFTDVDLGEMLATIAEIYAPLVEDCGRAIVVKVAAPARRRVHRELMGQALGNLIDNSVKYGAGTITLSLASEAGRPVLTVSDEGPGIAEADHAIALRRFGRLDTARGGSGAGLGLSLAAAVAHLHGGTLSLTDAAPGLVVTIALATD